jgi:hypothetical protein
MSVWHSGWSTPNRENCAKIGGHGRWQHFSTIIRDLNGNVPTGMTLHRELRGCSLLASFLVTHCCVLVCLDQIRFAYNGYSTLNDPKYTDLVSGRTLGRRIDWAYVNWGVVEGLVPAKRLMFAK